MVQVGQRPATATRRSPPPEADASEEPGQQTQPQARHLRRYTLEVPFDPELLPLVVLMALAFVLRVWDLGVKALHHDESLHAVYSWYLYQGRGYVHDPMMHGPLLYFGNALAYLVIGASDFSARIVPALLGVVLVGMPWLLRHEIGRPAAIAAAAFFAISPTFLYFSRFIRHDIYVDVFTLMIVVGVFRYLATAGHRWFYVAVVGASLLFASKEDFYISGFIPFTFLVGAWFLLRGEARTLFRQRVRDLGWRPWVLGTGVFLAINLILYTTFFTNLRGICTALVTLPVDGCTGSKGALSYWLDQHDFKRGGQPWFYYLMLLPLYEMPTLLLGLAAPLVVRGRGLFFWFCAYWFVLALGIYSWAGEKMPWMLPQIVLPLVFLAARPLGQWAQQGWGTRALHPRGLAVSGLVLLAGLCLLAWVGLGMARTVLPIEQQTVVVQRLALSVVIAAIAGGLVTLWSRWGRAYLLPGLALGAGAILAAGYVRTSLLVNYVHPDTPNEPLIYVQSSPDVVWITREIERIGSQTGMGKELRILMDNGWGDGAHESVAWPFEWYLRDYKNRRYFTRTIDPTINLADYPVLLAMGTNLDPIQEPLRQYSGQKYKLNWWFPEDYKLFDAPGPQIGPIRLATLRVDLLARTLADSQNQLKLVKFLLFREPPGELAGREMYFFVHNQVPQLGPSPIGGRAGRPQERPPEPAAAQPAQRRAVVQAGPDGSTVFGRGPDGATILLDPKGVAIGREGRLYVTEGRAGRVTVLAADGSVVTSWGTPGGGDGQFSEPWGIAVAPNGDVYVADTWNHRVQRFDPEGRFLGKWGTLGDARGRTDSQPSVFWGPRAIAISAQGEVYVTDTGNKRIQVFDLEGNFKRMFGGEGAAPGQLREPVGLALDGEGNLWVADAWNRRFQRLDPTGRPLAEAPGPAEWENQSVTNKPYLAVDGRGRLVATLPDAGRVQVFDPGGRVLSTVNLPGGASAIGVTTTPDGRLLVADARTASVLAYPLP